MVFQPENPAATEWGFVDAERAVYQERTYNSGFNYIADDMPATRHMANGKYYTSKHKFRQATRDAGCIEIGNETATLLKPRVFSKEARDKHREGIRRDLFQSIRTLQGYDYVPSSAFKR